MKKSIIFATAALIILAAAFGQGQSQPEIPDNLLILPGVRAGTNVLNQNGISDFMVIDDVRYRTAENSGVESILQELNEVYKNYVIRVECDVSPYKSADEMLNINLPDGLHEDHSARLTCLDSNGEVTGIEFLLTLKKSDNRTSEEFTIPGCGFARYSSATNG